MALHNLTLLLEQKIESKKGIAIAEIEWKKKQRIEEDRHTIKEAGRKENPLVIIFRKAVLRSFQFLEWSKNPHEYQDFMELHYGSSEAAYTRIFVMRNPRVFQKMLQTTILLPYSKRITRACKVTITLNSMGS